MSAKIPNLTKLQLANCPASRASLSTQERLKLCLQAEQPLLTRLVNEVTKTCMISEDITQRQVLGYFYDRGV